MKLKTEISIIIPTYNRAELIRATIHSVVVQTIYNWECIVVDDGSSDFTKDVIDEFSINDRRIKYIRNTRKKGAQGARNSGLIQAIGAWVVFFDSDDIMHPTFIEKLFNGIIRNNVDICTCHSNIVNRNTQTISGKFEWESNGFILYDLLKGKTYVDFNGAIIKKDRLFEIGLVDENCPSFQEWDTHIQLSKICKYFTIKEILVDYFVGGEDTISLDGKRAVDGYLYVLGKYKVIWPNESYYSYGKIVFNIIKEIKDKEFSKIKLRALFKLMPFLKLYIYKESTKHSFKTIFYYGYRIIKKMKI